MRDMYYVVQVLRQWSSLQVLGLPLQAHQGPDCIGFLPVFTSLEAAKAWRTEHGHESAGIVGMQPGDEEPA